MSTQAQGFAVSKRKRNRPVLKRLRRQAVEVDINGGTLTSDGGLLLLREVDRRLDLIRRVDQAIPDPRVPFYTAHPQAEILTSRIFGIAAGYEDANDHGTLRHDPAFQVAAGRTPAENDYRDDQYPLASPSTCSVARDPEAFYRTMYCMRGEMENRIKEQQLCLFADRTSCTRFLANQFRLLLSSFAYVLVDGLRPLALWGTKHARLRVDTIRLRLFKIAARVGVTCRRVVFHLASHCPYAELFEEVLTRLCRSD